MKFRHKTLVVLAGLCWLAIGIFLLSLGIHFLLKTLRDPSLMSQAGKFSFIHFLTPFVRDPTQGVVIAITLALFVGYFKGKMVLGKSVKRQLKRIASLPEPASLKYLYSKGYYLLIATMILLGISLRFFPITLDTRGTIDVAIGSALINGALLYFRALGAPLTKERTP